MISPTNIAFFEAIEQWLSIGDTSTVNGFNVQRSGKCFVLKNWRQEMIIVVNRLFFFVKSTIRYTLAKMFEVNTAQNKDDKYIYLKLPFINEELKRRALTVIRRSGIPNVKIHFINGKPSSRVFAPRKEKVECTKECELCKSAIRPNLCRKKNVVYSVLLYYISHC